jgi:hypothetical protein
MREATMRCPVCRADNDTGPSCRRCRADIRILFDLEDQRRCVLDAAYLCLNRGEMHRGRALAEGVRALRDDRKSRRLGAVAALLNRDFAVAWREFHHAAGE